MAVIQKDIELVGSKGRKKVLALFDSGASYSCINPELARQLEQVNLLPEPKIFGTAKDGEQLSEQNGQVLTSFLGATDSLTNSC